MKTKLLRRLRKTFKIVYYPVSKTYSIYDGCDPYSGYAEYVTCDSYDDAKN